MGIFCCPRLRGYWKKPDPPGTGPSYPLQPVASPPDGAVESGQSASRDDAIHSSSTGTSVAGLSEKLRKRFSREHKDLHGAPKRAQRTSGSSSFAHGGLDTVFPVGIGSSLMSERGYDSDAQFISTPKKINHTRDCLLAENLTHETASLSKSHSRGHGREGLSAVGSTSDVAKGNPANAHGLDQTITILEGTRNPWCSLDQAIWTAHPATSPPSPSSRVASRRYDYGSRTPRHTSPVPSHYATSVDSLAGPSSGLSVRKRRRQPPQSASGNNSVHLGDMDIHGMLASRTTSPRVLSAKHSFEGNPWASDARLRKQPQQLFDSHPAMGIAKVVDITKPTYRPFPEQASSCYSRPDSQYSAGSKIYLGKTEMEHSTTRQSQRSIHPTRDCSPRLLEDMINAEAPHSRLVDSHAVTTLASSDIHPGYSGTSSSISFPTNTDADLVSPRKVSVGWMSGGRRLGYGYTLVPAPEENDGPSKQQSVPSVTPDSNQEVPSEADARTEKAIHSESQPQQMDTTFPFKKAGTGLDISSIIGHIRSWSGATNEAAGDESPKSSLLGKLAKKKKDQSDPEPTAGARDPWDFCAWVDPHQSPNEQQPPQGSPSASSMSTEGRGISLGRWSTLRRTGSLWTKGRSMSAIARDLEAKAAAKLNSSAGRFPVIQKKEGQAMKFKVLDRKRRAQTDEDGEPMVPLKQWPDEKHTKPSQEGDGSSMLGRDPVRKQLSDKTGSTMVTEGWDSNYQDCEEILSVNE
ncbi:uncharacterized protein BO97DRAFT_472753 [Aspergillus homomorphus CBS 101889]|uniref:Uncharacterized protein n=1 Tax=Aspergillus homomorphus (strain CBS 101889) TaxID=1450537 RepID=A0A395HM42_ASPHC|nr:hypothetical protein BO97DRAFT_472753 [Aspergillus homomorphus CBS 101889]RAL09001.1 hypothetical protein BO97DRAFT_472753 [Aspergillus homomorphus CBS 101889]